MSSRQSVEHPGFEIARIIAHKGFSGSMMAQRSGLSKSLISQILSGNRRVTPNSALKLARALGVDAMDLVAKQRAFDLWVENQKIDKTLEPQRSSYDD